MNYLHKTNDKNKTEEMGVETQTHLGVKHKCDGGYF